MDIQNINEQLNSRRDFVTNSNNMFEDPDSKTSEMSTNSMELRKMHHANSEKCAVLEFNIKHLKRQHQLDLKEKDEIISTLKLELERANNMIKRLENVNAEKFSTANRMLDDRSLVATEIDIYQKPLDDIHSLERKFELKLERLQLEFERQHFESNKMLKKLNGDVMAIQEKMKEANNLKSTTSLNDFQLYKEKLPTEEWNFSISTSQLNAASDRYMNDFGSDEWNKTAEPGFINHSIPLHNDTQISQTELRGALIMVDGLDENTCNTDTLFNLLSLYGNVVWIHILEREESAIVQMADSEDVERCFEYLNKLSVGSYGRLKIVKYDRFFISKETSMMISDGSPRFKDYTAHPSRFESEHRVLPPIKNVFFYFAPTITENYLRRLLESQELQPTYISVTDKRCGLIRFENTAEAVWAIMKCNNMLIEYDGQQFPLKMNFSQY